ncbi:hypothetical protein L9F63_004157, partial [Diploptera punctata]
MSRTPEQNKLEQVLQRFSEPDYKCIASDELIYMEKLLTATCHLMTEDETSPSDMKRFELLQVTDTVGQVGQLLKDEHKNLSVKLAYVKMLCGLLNHDSGCKWILRTGEYKLQ